MDLLNVCHRMVDQGWRVNRIVTVEGRELEIISFPFPKSHGVSIGVMMREPNDSTTMHEFRMWDALCWNGCGPAVTTVSGQPVCDDCADHYIYGGRR